MKEKNAMNNDICTHIRTHISIFLLIATTLFSPIVSAGKINDTQDTTRDSSSSSSSSSSSRNKNDDEPSLLGLILRALFSGLHDSRKAHRPYSEKDVAFHNHPYENNKPGMAVLHTRYYSAGNTLLRERTDPYNGNLREGNPFGGMIDANYNYDWDNVHISTLRARLFSNARVGADLKWSGLFEPTDGDQLDTAHILEFGLTFTGPLHPAFLGRVGFTGDAMIFPGTADRSKFGGTFLFGFDMFPVRPLVISAEAQIGFLNYAMYLRGEGTFGVMVGGPVELNVGYRAQMFTNFSSDATVVYHGFTGGVRFWF